MEFSTTTMQQVWVQKESFCDSANHGAKPASFVGAGPAFKHYRRDKTNKAPRKRTFVANMTKQPQQLTETLASSARGVGSGLGTTKPAMSLATLGANSSVVTSAGAAIFGGAVASQPYPGALVKSVESSSVIAPAFAYGAKIVQQPITFGASSFVQRAGSSSAISSGIRPAGVSASLQPSFGGHFAPAQPQLMFSHGRPVAPTATFSDPELSAALARLEAGVIAAPAVPIIGNIRTRAVTTTLDSNTAGTFSRAVLTANVAPAASDIPTDSNVSGMSVRQGSFNCPSPAGSDVSHLQQMSMAAVSPLPSAGSLSPSRSSDDGSMSSLESAASEMVSPLGYQAAISRSASMSAEGSFTGMMLTDGAAAAAAAPVAEAWDDFFHSFLADDLDLDFPAAAEPAAQAPASLEAAENTGDAVAANIFRQWSQELPAAVVAAAPLKRGAEEMARSSLAAEVDALLSDLFSADDALPPAPKRARSDELPAAEGDDTLLPASWLDGLLSDDLYIDGAF